jgi:DNA replication protein DnaC
LSTKLGQIQIHFSDFSWEEVSFPAGFDRDEMLSCGFVERRENVVLFGGVGNGKSHTAVAMGIVACGKGYRVSFQHTSQLVLDLNAAAAAGDLNRKMAQLARCDMIVLDEWGYLPTDPEGAKLLFRVISMCYERISLVITTNIDSSRWYKMQHALMREGGWCSPRRASCTIGKKVHDLA